MKNTFKITALALVAFLTTFCSNPEKMAQLASLVKTDCNPTVLECKAGEIPATYTLTFPEKYFIPKAILKITPVLVYEGGQMEGKELWLQGEKIVNNYTVIAYKTGGSVSREITFPYKPGVEKATLELRATVYNSNKTKSYTYPMPFKIAEGTNCTYMLADLNGFAMYDADNWQAETLEGVETQILYDVNRAEVKNSRLNSQEVKEFEEFIKNAQEDGYKSVESSTIIGYASPEGPVDRNNTLSEQRAKSAKKAYDKTISKRANLDVPVAVEERGEDWEGFKKLVEESNMEDKDLIIRVLSMYSDPVVREKEIRNMSAVFQTLSNKVLPQLRRSRIVTNVRTKNFSDDELKQMIADKDGRLTEDAYLHYATVISDAGEKASVYKEAVSRFNSEKALNNLAALALEQGNASEALVYLNRMQGGSPSYYNNMGVVEMQKGNYDKAKELFNRAGTDEALCNIGVIDILTGDYNKAVRNLANDKKGCNLALAKILTGDLDGAQAVLTNASDPDQAYLRAIIAARKGNQVVCENELATSFAKDKYDKRAENDIEFAFLR